MVPKSLVNASGALQTDIVERRRTNFPNPLFYEAILYGHLHILTLYSEDSAALPQAIYTLHHICNNFHDDLLGMLSLICTPTWEKG